MGFSIAPQFNTANTIAGTILQSASGGAVLNPLYSSPLTGFYTGNMTSSALPMPSMYGYGAQYSPFTGTPTVLSSLGFLGSNMMFDPNTLNYGGMSPTLTPEMLAFLSQYEAAAAPPAPQIAAPAAPKPVSTPAPTPSAPKQKNMFEKIGAGISTGIGNFISDIGSAVSGFGNGISNILSGIGGAVSNFGQKLIGG